MALRQYTIQYSDGSKEHIGRPERDELLLSRLITPSATNTYKYIGQKRTYHALADLGELFHQMTSQRRQEPDCYPGSFIWEYKQKRYHERLESSEALVLRLQTA